MGFWEAYQACAGGVVLSAMIPILAKAVRQHFGGGGPAAFKGSVSFLSVLWQKAKPYAILAAFSLAVSFLIVALLGEKLPDWRAALLAGYLWDSTLQKIASSN